MERFERRRLAACIQQRMLASLARHFSLSEQQPAKVRIATFEERQLSGLNPTFPP
jgi:hypothetical protein